MSANQKHKRLSEVFEKSEIIEFTDEDRIVFFSDVHRGDNGWADEFARNQSIYFYALQHYYDAGFNYVEVGDGDELLKFKEIKSIRIAHEQIYQLLQKFHHEGRFQYVFGNHDNEYRNPEALAKKLNHHYILGDVDVEGVLFDGFRVHEGLIFSHKESGANLFVVHGHQGEFFNDRAIWLSQILLRRLWRPLQLLGFQDPTSVAGDYLKQQKIEQQLIDWVAKTNQPLICGHTHQERFPKKSGLPFFNIGSCVHPRWITCLEIKNGKIALVRWWIKPKKTGLLFVKRDVLRGPRKLTSYAPKEQDEAPQSIQ